MKIRLKFKEVIISILMCSLIAVTFKVTAQNQIIGSKSFVHLEKINTVWWIVDGDGNKFISKGMNHIGPSTRFASYNKEFWSQKFGENILENNRVNYKAKREIKNWMTEVAKDHKDYGFNTIAFHRPMTLDDAFFDELNLYYLGKIKTGHLHASRAKNNGGFPDVFSTVFKKHAEEVAKNYCSKHKTSKFLLGYTYDDLPSYSFEEYSHKIKYEGHKGGLLFHPWILDIINIEGITTGKKIWIDILKKHYKTPTEAAENYLLEITSWEELATISDWKKPKNEEKWQQDQTEMLKQIVGKWHQVNRNAILKYDPNHLILGDKISCHGQGHPDWVYQIVGKYVDVLLIQDYGFFKPLHVKKLERFYKLSGKPILNGDHSYGYTIPGKMTKSKGIQVESLKAIGEEYKTYLKGVMNLPFMIGWLNCGYLEQWKGSKTDNTRKQQTGLFDPYGNPRTEALNIVKEANKEASLWHEKAGKNEFEYSKRGRK